VKSRDGDGLPRPDGTRWLVLALVTVAHTLGAVTVLAVAPLSPLLLQDLGLTRAQVGLFLPATYLGGVLMSLPAGWVTDRVGARLTLAGGQLLTGAMTALAAWRPSLGSMLPLFLLSGLGWAVVNPTTGRAVIDRFPTRERGLAMGIKQTGLTLGGVTAALTLPAVALGWGWRVALTAAAAASIVSSLAVLVGLGPARGGAPLPAAGPHLSELGAFLSRRPFVVLLVCGLGLSIAQASVLAYLALFARERLGLGIVAAGGLLAVAQAGGTVARLGWGAVSDRLFGGRRRPAMVINAGVAAAAYLAFASGMSLPIPVAAALAAVAGMGAFGWNGLYFALTAEIGGPRHAGMLTGLAVSFAWSGILLGPLLFGQLLQATDSYRLAWLVLALISVASAVALHRLPPLVQRG
jgi:MFS family permease